MNLRGGSDTNCENLFRIRATKRNEFPVPDKSAARQSFPLGRVRLVSAQRKFGRRMLKRFNFRLMAALIFAFAALPAAQGRAETVLLNVSYDPTRELFREFDRAFVDKWRADTGEEIKILASHGGSGKQARAVIDGLDADVVTLALESDINAIVKKERQDQPGLAQTPSTQFDSLHIDDCLCGAQGKPEAHSRLGWPCGGWRRRRHHQSENLRRRALELSGGLGLGAPRIRRDEMKIKAFIAALYGNVSVLDAGARASATTFAQREIGDVLISWENEAYLLQKAFPDSGLEIVLPSISILAEPPVAVVDANVDAHGTRKAAEAYLQYLYSKEGQNIIARHKFRPALPDLVDARAAARAQSGDHRRSDVWRLGQGAALSFRTGRRVRPALCAGWMR